MVLGERKKNLRWVWVLGILGVLGLMTLDLNKYATYHTRRAGSLQRWLPIVPDLEAGQEIYQSHPDYLYPPIFLILLKPLVGMAMPWRALVYELVKQAALGFSLLLGWKIVARSFGKPRWVIFLLAIGLTARFFESDLSHGNVNIFLLMLVLLSGWLWQREKNLLAGIPLALAISIKVTPALFLLYAAWKRQWSLLIGALIGLFCFLFLLPALDLGWGANCKALQGWFDHVILPFSTTLQVDTVNMNQSLAATSLRILSHTYAMNNPTRYVNLMDLSRGQVVVIYKLLVLALLFIAGLGLQGKITWKDNPRFAIHFSIILLLMLLLSGYSWHAHFVYIFFPYLVLATLWDQTPPGTVKNRLLAIMGVSFLLAVVMPAAFGPGMGKIFESYGIITFANLFLLIAMVKTSQYKENLGFRP
jgi:alpha-1,2-mannosyltransferase